MTNLRRTRPFLPTTGLLLPLLAWIISPTFANASEPEWTATLTSTGAVIGTATNVSTVMIGASNAGPSTVPAPPAPPQYTTNLQLWPLNFIPPGTGPFFQDIRMTNTPASEWVLEVDPHGNVPPPTPRTATVSWDALMLGQGTWVLREGFDGTGAVVIADMTTTTSLNVTGTTSQFFTIVFTPATGVPDIDVTPVPHNYGNVTVGASASQTFTVSNAGTADLNVTATTLTGADAAEFNIDSGGAPFALAPGATQNVVVSFNPATVGAKSATLRFASDDPDENPFDVPLTGTGAVAAVDFLACLTGEQEVPPVVTSASGGGMFTLNSTQDTLIFIVRVCNLSAPMTAAHFHNAAAGVNGPVIRTLTGDFVGEVATGVWTSSDPEPLTPALVAALLAGNIYVNAHTTAHPGGEIRGQLTTGVPIALFARLNGGQEVPPVATTGGGLGFFTLAGDGSALTFNVTVNNLSGPIAAAHFHNAEAGINGPIVRTITGDFVGNTAAGAWAESDAEPLTPALVAELLAGKIYVNVHTAANPGGEIRGQVTKQAEADITVTPTSHDYGNVSVGGSATQVFMVSNDATATADLEVTATTLTGANAGEFNIDSGGAPLTLAPGATQNVVVSFNPATVGAKSATLRIASNDPDENPFDVPLMGNGVSSPLVCQVDIVTPPDSFITCTDSVEVCIAGSVSGGLGPVTKVCEVNGIVVDGFCVTIPLDPGSNQVIATCTFTDSVGNMCMASDTIIVIAQQLSCNVTIASPSDSSFVCATSVTVSGTSSLTGGAPPITATCTLNGAPLAVGSDGAFTATVTLTPGFNTLIASCTFVDSLGCTATCSDQVVVFSDPTPPTCTFNFDNLPVISGQAIDNESGIAAIEIVSIRNRIVTIDPFNPGDPVVGFSSDIIDPTQRSAFTLKITNRAGCSVLCDPIFLRLEPTSSISELTFSLPHTDRYLYVDNYGLSQILVKLNQHQLSLVATAAGEGRDGNVFYMPFAGARTIDLIEFLVEGENHFELAGEGPHGAYADILISDINVETDVRDKEGTIPQAFALRQNYPNPFNPGTTIAFEVPAEWTAPVTLRIYNLQGQLVRTLVDELVPTGRHAANWDGRDARGEAVTSGMYFYQITSGSFVATRRMTLVR